jgi:hypothetical protein
MPRSGSVGNCVLRAEQNALSSAGTSWSVQLYKNGSTTADLCGSSVTVVAPATASSGNVSCSFVPNDILAWQAYPSTPTAPGPTFIVISCEVF